MLKFIAVLVTSMMLSVIAGAHGDKCCPFVNIEKAEKVFIKKGMSKHHKLKMMRCLLMVKKHKTAEEAIDAKIAKLKAHCEKHDISAEKCERMKHKISKRVHACFTMQKFVDEFLGRAEAETKTESK